MRLADIGPGDEVITTPLTCTATNMPILMQGADIVWADVKTDFNIDPVSVEEKITEKTKAIICMHWGGYPCDLFHLAGIAGKHDLVLIEDAAHAYRSSYRDTAIGSCNYSDFTMFSFQAIKALTCVDGGALFCKGQVNYDRGKLLRWFGIDREGLRRDMRCEEEIVEYGYKYHMNDLSATIGLNNMEFARKNVKKCQENGKYFETQLAGFDGIELTQTKDDRRSSYWLFTMLVEDRTSFVHKMGAKGIHVSRVHELIDKHHLYSHSQYLNAHCLDNIFQVQKPSYNITNIVWKFMEQKASFFISMLKSFYHYQKDTSYASLRHLQSQVSVLKLLSSLF